VGVAGKILYVHMSIIEVRISDGLQNESRVTIHRKTKPSKQNISFVSTILCRVEARSKEEDEVRENAYNVKRSESVPIERGRHMSDFLPKAPLARTLGAEESYMYVYVYV